METIVPKTICEKCGMKVEPGLMNWVRHDEEHHAEDLMFRPEKIESLTIEDIQKAFEKLGNCPQRKPQMVLQKWMLELASDGNFVNYIQWLGENWELMCGRETYEYLKERYERLSGEKI